jgi:ABC-type transporter Mla subunit MlaD
VRRLAVIVLALAAIGAGAIAMAGAGGEQSGDPRYFVEMDNAFGLVEGADVKVAGVRAGQVKSFAVDPKTYDAVVEIEIGKKGFGDLRKDVFCESRPQSLIGEYFLDCLPGTAKETIKPGSRIPVAQTGSTIPADLINNIMRRPYRERFSILLGELGAALTARGEDLNETIRRANPALRETNKVLAQLREQRTVIRDLTTNARTVVGELADKKGEVSRFIDEARDTSLASSKEYAGLREQFQRFPGFLRELRPTMSLLGEAADRQRPALQNLSDNSELLTRFLDDLAPFSDASRPAFRSLAETGRQGRDAVKVSIPRVKELRAFAAFLPEVAQNLAITLQHLDDRRFAVEKDPRSPGGQGYTGLEALLQYVFRQSQATNVYDANSYLLKVSLFLDNNCAQYADVKAAKDPAKQYCRAILGPNQVGIDNPDPSATTQKSKRTKSGKKDDETDDTPGSDKPQALLDQALGGKSPVVPNTTDPVPLMDFLLG